MPFLSDNSKLKKKTATPIKERITYFLNIKNETGNSLKKLH